MEWHCQKLRRTVRTETREAGAAGPRFETGRKQCFDASCAFLIAADTAHDNLTLSLSVLCFGLGFLQFLHRFTLHLRIGGIVVSIAAFQAVDPGSIPGQRKTFFIMLYNKMAKMEGKIEI